MENAVLRSVMCRYNLCRATVMGYTRILKSPEKPLKNVTKDNIKSTAKTEQYKYLIHHKLAGKQTATWAT